MTHIGTYKRFGALWQVYANSEGFLECVRTTRRNKDGEPIESERRVTNATSIDELKPYFRRKARKKSKHTEDTQLKIQ